MAFQVPNSFYELSEWLINPLEKKEHTNFIHNFGKNKILKV